MFFVLHLIIMRSCWGGKLGFMHMHSLTLNLCGLFQVKYKEKYEKEKGKAMLDFETPTYVTAKEAQHMQSQVRTLHMPCVSLSVWRVFTACWMLTCVVMPLGIYIDVLCLIGCGVKCWTCENLWKDLLQCLYSHLCSVKTSSQLISCSNFSFFSSSKQLLNLQLLCSGNKNDKLDF